jgi:hypothetical protein
VKATTVHNVFVLLKLVPSVFLKQIVVTRMKLIADSILTFTKTYAGFYYLGIFLLQLLLSFQYYQCGALWQAKSCVRPDYMSSQQDINSKMRAILIDWLIEVQKAWTLQIVLI